MLKVSVYNLEGAEVETMSLREDIFGVKINQDILHQVIVSLSNNQRNYTAHTKNKGEVSGGGRKPWKQKGTGRARAGSTRSPIWKGGGVTFGPRNERNYESKINKKVARLAFLMALSSKLKDGELKIVDSFSLKEAKTKIISASIDILAGKDQATLLLMEGKNDNLKKAAANLKKVTVKTVLNASTFDLFSKKMVILEKKSIEKLEEKFKLKEVSKKEQ